MTAIELIQDFTHRGIRLIPRPPKLTVVPAEKLTDADRAAIRAHKAELMVYLRAQQVARWCDDHHVDITIGMEILEIEQKALDLGWRPERLWNPDFWPHTVEHPRGLASVLQPGDTIMEVARDFITIEKDDSRRTSQRFPRADA